MRLFIAILLIAMARISSGEPAQYDIHLVHLSPPRLAVTASLPMTGDELHMATTRPGDIAELDAGGWPALVENLEVFDDAGHRIAATRAGAKGWRLATTVAGRLRVKYEVDYSILAARKWPAQREAAFADANHFVVVGRSLFVTTSAMTSSRVTFHLPRPWRPVVPWIVAADPAELVDNLIVLSRSAPDVVTAAGFRVSVVTIGHWQAARGEVRRALRAVIPELVRLIGFKGETSYVVVLLPEIERGGESFRSSFALTLDAPATRTNRAEWANLIAHEVFHYWNGWRLAGADYASSQWFQEGFTEYAANISMRASGLIDDEGFRQKIAQHIANYAKLKTTLEAPGTHKGPPLYSGGALVAFSWDVMIRHATNGKRSIADVYRNLWTMTDGGRIKYDWPLIKSALDAVSKQDWDDFHRRYIAGDERLPLDAVLKLAGTSMNERSRSWIDAQPRSFSVRTMSVRRISIARATPAPPAAPRPYA